MKLMRATAVFLMTISVLVCWGCGGSGGSNTTGVLSLDVTPTAAGNKSVITAVATFTGSTKSPQGMEVTFTTDHPNLFLGGTAQCSATGEAVFTFVHINNPVNPPSSPTTVNVFAKAGDLMRTTNFLLTPATIQVTPPASLTAAAGANAPGSVIRFVPSGMVVNVTDGVGSPLSNVDVTVSIDSVTNGIPNDVLFWDSVGQTHTTSTTGKTDSVGNLPITFTLDVAVPSVRPYSYNVVWKASFKDPDTGATITKYANTLVSVT